MSANKGVTLSLLSSVLFAVLCYYSVFLSPLNGWQIAAWRALTTVPLLILLLALRQELTLFLHYIRSVVKSGRLFAATFICAALLGLQIVIFCWAPVNGQSRALALGYFMLPLVMVVIGRVLYGEKMTAWQKSGVLLTACGVTAHVFMVHALPVVALVVMLGYPPYFIIKRRLKSTHLFSIMAENLLLVTPALFLLALQAADNPVFPAGYVSGWLALSGLGVLSGSALLCFLLASRALSFTLFGMLSYVEPLLLFIVSLLLPGEKFSPSSLITYIPIGLATFALLADGYTKMKRNKSHQRCS
ncbi:EamA family transporter RarD [Pantoea sp. FN060301]|uniref:EamA family transporter RarD n=1 Tax=Pantoea sp. FN060301 TaxID=3420380 RepID=UPI003D167156